MLMKTDDLSNFRCLSRLASSLVSLNIVKHDVVSVLAPNVPAMYEMHFAVPMVGAVLNPVNTRLDVKSIATILKHSGAKVFFVDCYFVTEASEALSVLDDSEPSMMPLVIIIDDIDSPTGVWSGELEYEQLIHKGNPGFVPFEVSDEWDPIALNYTSGTTSEPKDVAYSHQGAYLSTLSLILGWEMGNDLVYLWTLPMFHCNGWTFTWGVAEPTSASATQPRTTFAATSNYIKSHTCAALPSFSIYFSRPKPTSTAALVTLALLRAEAW